MITASAKSDSLRHTYLVRLLRAVLSLLMLGLLGGAVWRSLDQPEEGPILTLSLDHNRIEYGQWLGLDQQHRPYQISWELASQASRESKVVSLVRPSASFFQDDGSWVAASALSGTYDHGRRVLILEREVQVLRDDGLELNTARAEVDLKAKTIRGDQDIIGQGPSGIIEAEGFLIEDFGESIALFDRVTVSGS